MLDDRFYPQAGGVERHLPVRPGSSLYVRRPEDGPQHEASYEVENAWDLQEWVGRPCDVGGAAVTATEAELSATFMPPFQGASGLPQQQQQHHHHHHPYHRRPSPDSAARGAGTDGDLSARSTAALADAGNFADLRHSRVGWEPSSGASPYSTDTRTLAHREVPQGVGRGVSLGRRQELDMMQNRPQQSSGSDYSSGDHSISRRYNSYAEENFSDHSTSVMRGGEVPRDLAKHRYERAPGPASVFQTQQVFERRATEQPGRGGRGRDNAIEEGFSVCNNNRDAVYHSRDWRCRSQPRTTTSPGPTQHCEGPPLVGTLYQLGPTSPPPSSSPLFGRQEYSSSSTSRRQNVLDSSPVRSLSGTYCSRMGGRYDDVLEPLRRFSLATRSSVPITPSWAAQRRHDGADSINTSDRDHGDCEELVIDDLRGQAGRQGRGGCPSNICTGSALSSSLSYSSDPLDADLGHHSHYQHHQYQHHEHRQQQQQQDKTTSGDAFDVLRRAPVPHYARIHHDDPRQINCFPDVSHRSEGDTNRRPSARRLDPTIATLSASDGLHQRHHGGGCLPSRRTEAEHGCAVGGDDGGTPAVVAMAVQSPQVAPSFAAPSPAPGSPFEWLKNMNLRQSSYGTGSRGVDEGTDTPSTASSSSSASTASSLAIATVDSCDGGDGSRIIASRSEFSVQERAAVAPVGSRAEMVTAAADGVCRTCPAPDCPGNGDCLPGATLDMLVYEVQFKRAIRTFLPGENIDPANISCGVLMKVEADRGEDVGIIHRSLPLSEYLHAQNEERKAKAAKIAENGGGGGGSGDGSESKKKRSKSKKAEEDGGGKNGAKRRGQQNQSKPEEPQEKPCPVRAMKRILRPATAKELRELQDKSQQEVDVLRVSQHKVRQRSLPMKIVDAEYQFDMHKLTLFYEAERRIDFRELVRDLFAVYKTRIWMQQVKDKDQTTRSGARAAAAAAIATATSNDSDETAPPTASPDDSDGGSGAHQEWGKGPESNPSFAAAGSFLALAFPHNVGYALYGSESSSGRSSSGSGGD